MVWTTDFLSDIANIISDLFGAEYMIYELIQNAEDKHSNKVVMRINQSGFTIENDAIFSTCENFLIGNTDKCSFLPGQERFMCDWHRIQNTSGGNSAKSQQKRIGKFGRGFISVLQITDTPIIESGQNVLTMNPVAEIDRNRTIWTKLNEGEELDFTRITLPWALDHNSQFRLALLEKGIASSRFPNENISEEILSIARQASAKAILHLKHIKRIEIWSANGLATSYERIDKHISDNLKRVEIFENSKLIESRLLLLGEVTEEKLDHASQLISSLGNKRQTSFDISIPLSRTRNDSGYFYAFLPTGSETHLPIDVNADFYPDESRKYLKPKQGNDLQFQWNELIWDEASKYFAEHLEELLEQLGPMDFWLLLRAAYQSYEKFMNIDNGQLSPKNLWRAIQSVAPEKRIVSIFGNPELISPQHAVILPTKIASISDARDVMYTLGIKTPAPELTGAERVLLKLGARTIHLQLFLSTLGAYLELNEKEYRVVDTECTLKLTQIWQWLDFFVKDEPANLSIEVKRTISEFSIWPEISGTTHKLNDLWYLPQHFYMPWIQDALPEVRLVPKSFSVYGGLIENLFANRRLNAGQILDLLEKRIAELFETLADLSPQLSLVFQVCRDNRGAKFQSEWRKLKLWQTYSKRLVSAETGNLPGGFEDPLGVSDLIDVSIFETFEKTERNEFLLIIRNEFGIKDQDITEYVSRRLPQYLQQNSQILSDNVKYRSLIEVLTDHHRNLISPGSKTLQSLQNMPIVLTTDGRFISARFAVTHDAKMSVISENIFTNWTKALENAKSDQEKAFWIGVGIRERLSPDEILNIWAAVLIRTEERSLKPTIQYFADYLLSVLPERSQLSKDDPLAHKALFKAKSGSALHTSQSLLLPSSEFLVSELKESLVLDLDLDEKNIQKLNRYFGFRERPSFQEIFENLQRLVSQRREVSERYYEAFYFHVTESQYANRNRQELQKMRDTKWFYLSRSKEYVAPSQMYFKNPQVSEPISFHVEIQNPVLKEVLIAMGANESADVVDYVRMIGEIDRLLQPEISLEARNELIDNYGRIVRYFALQNRNQQINDSMFSIMRSKKIIMSEEDKMHLAAELFYFDEKWIKRRFSGVFTSKIARSENGEVEEFLSVLGVQKFSTNILGKLSPHSSIYLEEELTEELNQRRIYFNYLAKDNSNTEFMPESVKIFGVDSLVIDWQLGQEIVKSTDLNLLQKVFCNFQIENALYLDKSILSEIKGNRSSQGWLEVFKEIAIQGDIGESTAHMMGHYFQSLMNKSEDEIVLELGMKDSEFSTLPYSNQLTRIGTSTLAMMEEAQKDGEVFEESPDVGSISRIENYPNLQKQNSHSRTSENFISAKPDRKSEGLFSSDFAEKALHPRKSPNSGMPRQVQHTSTSQGRGSYQDPKAHIYAYEPNSSVGEESIRDRWETERKAIDYLTKEVLAKDFGIDCKIERQPQNNEGFDLMITNSLNEIYKIEVKGLSGPWEGYSVTLSPSQIELVLSEPKSTFIYVVENLDSPSETRSYRISNLKSHTKGFKLNEAWQTVSKVQSGQSVSELESEGKLRIHNNKELNEK